MTGRGVTSTRKLTLLAERRVYFASGSVLRGGVILVSATAGINVFRGVDLIRFDWRCRDLMILTCWGLGSLITESEDLMSLSISDVLLSSDLLKTTPVSMLF